jgi:D-xylose transport system ATP-binding protein
LSTLQHFASFGRIDRDRELETVRVQIERLRIKTASPALPIANLSGGNQQKAVFTRMLLAAPKLLILDEPTRGVDVGAKVDIYELIFALAAQGVAIVMVSSDLSEVLGVSDRVLVIGEGSLRGDFINEGLTQERVLAAAIDHGARAA